MELVLQNRDYVLLGNGRLRRASGIDALLCQALFRLTCRRESFPFMPELGSRLWTLRGSGKERLSALATAYCVEALSPLPLTVQGVTLQEGPGNALRLQVQLAVNGKTEQVEVTL